MAGMGGDRAAAVDRAYKRFDDGSYLELLRQLVAIPTESQISTRLPELYRYCSTLAGPILDTLGFKTEVLDNPHSGAGPVMLASRMEDPAKPTVLIYGHGDVVRGIDSQWRSGLDPWRITVEGDCIYGRGTVDNKGQHLIAIEGMRAVLQERGCLGFNAKVFIETGEEVGSPGISEFLSVHRDRCAADVFIGLDGVRQTTFVPEIKLGARGAVAFDLIVRLREGAHHSGHWGGILADPGFILAHALSTIVSKTGQIQVQGWTPAQIPESVRRACAGLLFEDLPNLPKSDRNWGEPGLSLAEKLFAWTSVVILAYRTGDPGGPTNSLQPEATARLQVRHTVDISGDDIIPALRRHLDDRGFQTVAIEPIKDRDMFLAARTDPDEPWVRMIAESLERTTGRAPNVVPNSSGGNPSKVFMDALGVPVIWIPNSYAGCSQHAPNEHALAPLLREGLGIMAGIWWDVGADVR
jgi:acetylornithine deacetylase/succinyl-diaminopimelate desuccinylase-like protein